MKNRILNDLVSSPNKKLFIGLIILVLFLVIGGTVGLYSFYKSNEKAIQYYHAVKDAKDLQGMYREQSNKWKIMILSRENASVFPKNYYEFSKLSDKIQDNLFNLKMKFIGKEDNIGEKIEQVRSFNQKVYDRYVSLIFENLADDLSSHLPYLMQEDETKMHDDLEKITTSITNLADKEIGKVAKDYFFMAILFLVMLIAIAIMMIVIITGKRRE
jgi:hypothetical protein